MDSPSGRLPPKPIPLPPQNCYQSQYTDAEQSYDRRETPDSVPRDADYRESTLEVACTTTSRTTLIVFFLLSNSGENYGPAGLRLGYGGYHGNFQVDWPIGQRPTLSFKAHERYQGGADPFPTYFPRRASKCIDMVVGIVDRGNNLSNKQSKVAFAGRKPPKRWLLKLLPKRFNAQRSAADLYNLLGGRAHEVDFLFRECLAEGAAIPIHSRALQVPLLEADKTSIIYVKDREEAVIADCLDHLPWSPIAWSMHRGLKDVIIAYATPYFTAYREPLARILAEAVSAHFFALQHRGWDATFVRESMAEQAASAILGGDRCSGDVCRIVTGIAELLFQKPESLMDTTTFWTMNREIPSVQPAGTQLSADTIVALIKVYLVRWSKDFAYGINPVFSQTRDGRIGSLTRLSGLKKRGTENGRESKGWNNLEISEGKCRLAVLKSRRAKADQRATTETLMVLE
ncbi:MAG: hypothetical protein Q9188_003526 [Gyalolechia gomerana]